MTDRQLYLHVFDTCVREGKNLEWALKWAKQACEEAPPAVRREPPTESLNKETRELLVNCESSGLYTADPLWIGGSPNVGRCDDKWKACAVALASAFEVTIILPDDSEEVELD